MSMSKNWNFKFFSIFFCLGLVALSSSCGKVKNSSSGDFNLYGSGVSGSTNFLQARAVLATHCLSCHAEWSNFSEQDYISNSRVTAGNPSSSTLYTKIRGNDAGVEGNMPENRPDLSYDDIKKIKDWILSI